MGLRDTGPLRVRGVFLSMRSIYRAGRIAMNMGSGQREGLTWSIIGCAFSVSNELGNGFLESVYEKAMTIALDTQGIRRSSASAYQRLLS